MKSKQTNKQTNKQMLSSPKKASHPNLAKRNPQNFVPGETKVHEPPNVKDDVACLLLRF
jgi:hypothetical protein